MAELVSTATLSGQLRIPGSVGDIDVCCDLRAGTVAVSLEAAAPQAGRLPTRVNWLVRQLGDAPGQLRVDGLLAGTKASTSELLSTLREDPAVLVDSQKRDFRAFRITAVSQLGTKRGTGRGAFIDSVLSAVDGFYEVVGQTVRPWAPKAPQLPRSGKSAAEDAGIDTTPPPADLADDVEPELVTTPEKADVPTEVAAEVSATEEVATGTPPPPPPLTMVMWDRASERLDREREHVAEQRSDS